MWRRCGFFFESMFIFSSPRSPCSGKTNTKSITQPKSGGTPSPRPCQNDQTKGFNWNELDIKSAHTLPVRVSKCPTSCTSTFNLKVVGTFAAQVRGEVRNRNYWSPSNHSCPLCASRPKIPARQHNSLH